MLGSLNVYRRLLHEHVFTRESLLKHAPHTIRKSQSVIEEQVHKLPTIGHAIAGIMAGWTVSLIAAPVEHVKARLQIQYAADKRKRLYSGPIDCSKRIVRIPAFRPTSDLPTEPPLMSLYKLTFTAHSYVPTASAVSTTASPLLSSSAPSSSSGGARTISSRAC